MINQKKAFLFPGQGAQFPGMVKDFWEHYSEVKSLFEKASDFLGRDMKALLFEGSEQELKETVNTQVAVTLANLSVLRALHAENIHSDCAAGFSLGKFSAMADAGILSEEDVLSLVVKRGEIMASSGDKAIADHGEVGMGAVIGMDFESVKKVLEESGVDNVFAANDNSPSQVVISGTAEGIGPYPPAGSWNGGIDRIYGKSALCRSCKRFLFQCYRSGCENRAGGPPLEYPANGEPCSVAEY